MRKKRGIKGETLVETLAAILIVTLSSVVFMQMTMIASKISTQARRGDSEFQMALSVAEQQQPPAFDDGIVTIGGRGYTVDYYSGVSDEGTLTTYAFTGGVV